jgi:hypothetical protein
MIKTGISFLYISFFGVFLGGGGGGGVVVVVVAAVVVLCIKFTVFNV